jgi:magnesium transporter
MKANLNDYVTNRVPIVHTGEQVGHVLDHLRENDFDNLQHVFVTDRQNRIIGSIELGRLLKSSPAVQINLLTIPCDAIDINSTLEYAANHALSKQMQSIPVTNSQGIFMGILPAQVIIETLRKEHIEDLHKLAGIINERSNASLAVTELPVSSVWHRLPWLLVGLIGSFLVTFVMTKYEKMLDDNISLAFFIPGIVYLADAIGTQTETIVIRGLSLSWTSFGKLLRREFLAGSLIGLILGVLSLLAAMLGGFDLKISLVVGISIMVAGTIATTIGFLFPWLLLKLGKDPAFGSGPLATIVQDILSIFVYFLIANALLTII